MAGRILRDDNYENDAQSSGFEDGCRHLRSQTVKLRHNQWSQVIVYLVTLGASTYVCGLKVLDPMGHNIVESMVGYKSARYEKLGYSHWNWVEGFVAAVGPQGIRALQLVGAAGERSHWAGNPKDCPKTRRLVFDMRTITYLVAGFDVSSRYNVFIFFAVKFTNHRICDI